MTDDLDLLFNRLRGQWKLEREVAGMGSLHGGCVFSDDGPHRLVCEERGTWDIGATDGLEAFRSYVYEFDVQRRKIVILYNDSYRSGDVLHELDFVRADGELRAFHSHKCGDDRYDLQMRAEDGGRIFMEYIVKGPKKDYLMKTVLTPEPS